MKRNLFTLCLLLMVSLNVIAQQFPVQVTPQLLPPYSTQVSEYYSAVGNPKLSLLIVNRDFNKPTLNVRMRMSIEGQGFRLRTKEDVYFAPLTILAGQPYYVTPAELAQYFAPNKVDISGMSPDEYAQVGKLPEGFYTFCFEVVETGSNQTVSNRGCTFAWMNLNEPPMLNLPRKGESVTPAETPGSQSIVFNWTPRHTASPGAAFTTTYVFTIAELTDNTIAPEAGFINTPPLYTDSTNASTYVYDGTKAALVPGKTYAWRVQAKTKDGITEVANFKNNGYSEIFWFAYKNTCPIVQGISDSVKGYRAVIDWLGNPLHLGYKLIYREKNRADAEWFTLANTGTELAISDLKPQTEYEYRVGCACEQEVFSFAATKYFTTKDSTFTEVPNCGVDPNLATPANTSPLTLLNPLDTVYAGDFKIVVTKVSGASGTFTGEGYVPVSYLANMKLAVVFNGIGVNTEKKLVSGQIQTTYDPTEGGIESVDAYIDYFTAGYGVGEVVTGEVTADTTFNFTIGSISALPLPANYDAATGTVTGGGSIPISITPAGSNTPVTYNAEKLPVTIMDKDGTIYQVAKNGTVTKIGNAGGSQWIKKMNPKQIDDDIARVNFVEYTNSKVQYAFDEWKDVYSKSTVFKKEYERLRTVKNEDYYVSAKAIAPAATDYIKATIKFKVDSIVADSIKFVSGTGIIYTSTKLTDTTYEIAIVGGPAKDAQEIYAVYPQAGGKTLNFGKVLVASYPRREYKVKLIPVNGTTINQILVTDKLNSIYNKINIYWEVLLEPNFEDHTWDEHNDGLDVTGSGVFSTQTSEMKALNKAYSASHFIDPGLTHIFVLNNANEQNVAGDMPRGKQFGYVFTLGNNAQPQTISHELGHGFFKLKHTFDGYGLEKDDLLENLMNYNNGEALSKMQWDIMHNPGFVLGLFDADKDGESLMVNNIGDKFLNPDKQTYSFYAPNGTFITLPSHTFNHTFFYGLNNSESYKLPTGSLSGFCAFIGGRKRLYELKFAGNECTGFIEKLTGNEAPDSLFKTTYADSVVMGIGYSSEYAIIKVRASGIQNYKTEVNKGFMFEPDMAFNAFPTSINSNNKKTFTYQSNPQIIGGGAQSISESDIKLIAPHEEKEEMLVVEKIIQLKTLYPKLFIIFSTYFDDWDNVLFTANNEITNVISTITVGFNNPLVFWDQKLKNNPLLKAKWKNSPKEFYSEFLNEWVLFIQNFNSYKTTLINSLSTETPSIALMAMLELCSEEDLENITPDKRLLSISILASNDAYFDEDYERQIIRLVKNTPAQQCDEISLGLKGPNKKIPTKYLLKQLIYTSDDSFLGFGDDNYKNLLIAICKVISKSTSFRQKVDEVTLDNFLDYNVDYSYKTIWSRLWNNGTGVPYIKSSVVTEYSTNKVTLTNEYVYKGLAAFSSTKSLDVFDPIWLANNSSLTMLNDISSDATGAMLPAIVLKYIDDKGTVKTAGDIINAVVDAASIASGAGAIYKAVTGLRRALVVIDMVGSGISLSDNLTGGFIQSQNPKAFAIMNALTAVVGIAQIGKWGTVHPPINTTTKITDIYNVTKNFTEEVADVNKAEKLCFTVIDGGTELNLISKPDLAVAKKAIERIKIEADVAGKTELVKNAENALEKLGDVKFLQLDAVALQRAKTFIETAIAPGTQFGNDSKTIEAVALFLDPANSNALQALGGETELERILRSNKDMPCPTCKTSVEEILLGKQVFGGRNMHEMLGDLMDFGKRFSSKPEFVDIIKGNKGLGHPLANVREGTQHMLNTIRQDPLKFSPQTINRMDMVFEASPSSTLPCTLCRFDLEMIESASPRFYEFKSYLPSSIIGLSVDQFKNYLSQVTDWDQFHYVFNRLKTPDLDLIKREFQKVFVKNATEIWGSNNNLMKSLKLANGKNVNSLEEFILLTKTTEFWKQLEFITIN